MTEDISYRCLEVIERKCWLFWTKDVTDGHIQSLKPAIFSLCELPHMTRGMMSKRKITNYNCGTNKHICSKLLQKANKIWASVGLRLRRSSARLSTFRKLTTGYRPRYRWLLCSSVWRSYYVRDIFMFPTYALMAHVFTHLDIQLQWWWDLYTVI